MKNIILFSFLVLFSLSLQAKKGKYKQKMSELIAELAISKTESEFQKVSNQFLNVARAEKKEWLAWYYHGYCQVVLSFVVDPKDAARRDLVLDQAELAVNKLLDLASKETEVHVLHGFFLLGRLSVNPQARGATYSMQSQVAIGKALLLDPENVRARYMKLSNDMGTARFFGGDLQAFCQQATELLGAWDNFKLESELHPDWGKSRLEGIVEGCGK